MKITVLAGGVGAARFLAGLCQCTDPTSITAICNVSDDLEWHGLHVSPDIDSVIYTLAGLEGEAGWGVRGDTTGAIEALRALGSDEWFTIGDRDLATHLWRSEQLRAGATLAEATASIARARGIASTILPVTNDEHRTTVLTAEGPLPFQEYFVRHRAALPVTGFTFSGSGAARPAPGALDAIESASLIVIAPSNPFVSIAPILEVAGVRDALASAGATRVAISPIVGGEAIKGPAANMLRDLGHAVSAVGVAALYRDIIDRFVLDEVDAALIPDVEALGLRAVAVDTMMTGAEGRRRVAAHVLEAGR